MPFQYIFLLKINFNTFYSYNLKTYINNNKGKKFERHSNPHKKI